VARSGTRNRRPALRSEGLTECACVLYPAPLRDFLM
jgi:hypothetical protein